MSSEEVYVTPHGATIQRSQLTDEQAATYWGSEQTPPGYTSWKQASDIAKAVHRGLQGKSDGLPPTPGEEPGLQGAVARQAGAAASGADRIKFTFGTPDGGTRTVGLTEARQIMHHNRNIRKAVWSILGGAALFICGIVFAFQSYPVVDGVTATPTVCNTGIGVLGQAFDAQAYAACQQASSVKSMHDWAAFLIIAGLIVVIGCVGFLRGKSWAKMWVR
jgi:hypothetical protein